MKKRLFTNIYILILLLLFPSLTYSFEGPLQVNNQFPLFLHLNVPGLEQAKIENSFSMNLLYSSINLVRDSSEWSMGLDMEITEVNLHYRRKLSDSVEVGIDVPLLQFHNGFMDDFLETYHDAFGFADYGRSFRPKNEFLYEVKRNGMLIIKGEEGHFGLGDVRISLKKAILKNNPAVSIGADIEFPTGNAKKGYGSGNIDAGIFVQMDKKLSENINTYYNIGVVFPGDLKAYETVKMKEFIHAGAGIEAEVWENFSLLTQLFFQTSPYPSTKIAPVDRNAVLLSFGGRYVSGYNSLEVSLTEDPSTSGAPDFTLGLSIKIKF